MVTVTSFIVILGIFFTIGLASVVKSKGTKSDYYLANQSVSPLFSGLSAVATNNSGFMFIGVIGYTYTVGLAAVWLMLGWIIGDFLASFLIHRQLHSATIKTGEASYTGVLATWTGGNMLAWRRISAVLILIFLGVYAAAQISAGSKALESVLAWNRTTGALIVALMVLSYSVAGGIRASIWTDVAQSIVMMLAMIIMVVCGIEAFGGMHSVISAWQEIPGYFDLAPKSTFLPGVMGAVLFLLGWLVAGLSVIGQPHVMVRFMALNNAKSMNVARFYYYSFFTLFYALATIAGMLARLHLPDLNQLDPELALPKMAVQLLHPALVGVVLAGIFAATMSTADSLVLSCSAVITHDLLPGSAEQQVVRKLVTAIVTGLALFIALYASSNVFDLVIMSWSVMAAAFAPLLILLASGRVLTEKSAIIIMFTGVAIVLLWRYAHLQSVLYEGLPGILLALLLGHIISKKRVRSV